MLSPDLDLDENAPTPSWRTDATRPTATTRSRSASDLLRTGRRSRCLSRTAHWPPAECITRMSFHVDTEVQIWLAPQQTTFVVLRFNLLFSELVLAAWRLLLPGAPFRSGCDERCRVCHRRVV